MTHELFIDVDTHVTEPPDTWSARVPVRFRDRAPSVERPTGTDLDRTGAAVPA